VRVQIPPPTSVITSVFLAWACGIAVIGAVSRTWKEIQPGHFKVIWLATTGLSLAAGFGYHPAWLLTGASLLTYAAIYRNADIWTGSMSAVLALLVLLAGVDLDLTSIASALLLGAVSSAMLLGHWHLNQPRLGTRPIERMVLGLWAGIVLFGVSVLVLALHATGVATLGAWTALVFTAFAAVLTGPVHYLVRTRSIMSATGILYLEILLCLVAAFTGTLAALAR
jgi:hypothetical protein